MTDFYDGLRLQAWSMSLAVPTGASRLSNGQSIPFSMGEPYWRGKSQLAPHYHATQAASEVDLMRLQRPGETFLVYDARFDGPQADPGGAALNAYTPLIHALDADNRRLRVSWLPAGYVLTKGDYIGWQATNPQRYFLHRVAETVAASISGLTPLFAVEPHIRPGATVGMPVQLVQPVCRARVVEATYGSARPLITEGASFDWEESLR
jgi:hypothetical protein